MRVDFRSDCVLVVDGLEQHGALEQSFCGLYTQYRSHIKILGEHTT